MSLDAIRQGRAPQLLGVDPLALPLPDDSDPATWPVERASRVLRLIAQLRHDQAMECGAYVAEVQRLGELQCAADVRYRDGIARFEAMLARWFDANRPASKKSWALPGGTVGTRLQPARVEVQDVPAAVLWASQYLPDAVVRPDPRVAVAALTAHMRTTGEVPAGCEVVPATETFYTKTEAEDGR